MKEWLSSLFIPYIKQSHSIVKAQYNLQPDAFPSPPSSPTVSDGDHPHGPESDQIPPGNSAQGGYVTLLQQHLLKNKRNLEWKYDREDNSGSNLPIWQAKAMVAGQDFATGRGGTKKIAKMEAAKVAAGKLKLV